MMSKTILRTLPRQCIFLRSNSTNASLNETVDSSKWSAKPWKITAAVSVERMPIVTPELDGMQQKMKVLLEELEVEQSKKCDHEIRVEEDL